MICIVLILDEGGWAEGTEDHVVGEAKFDFVADREDELSLTQGQRINLAPAGKSEPHTQSQHC